MCFSTASGESWQFYSFTANLEVFNELRCCHQLILKRLRILRCESFEGVNITEIKCIVFIYIYKHKNNVIPHISRLRLQLVCNPVQQTQHNLLTWERQMLDSAQMYKILYVLPVENIIRPMRLRQRKKMLETVALFWTLLPLWKLFFKKELQGISLEPHWWSG